MSDFIRTRSVWMNRNDEPERQTSVQLWCKKGITCGDHTFYDLYAVMSHQMGTAVGPNWEPLRHKDPVMLRSPIWLVVVPKSDWFVKTKKQGLFMHERAMPQILYVKRQELQLWNYSYWLKELPLVDQCMMDTLFFYWSCMFSFAI